MRGRSPLPRFFSCDPSLCSSWDAQVVRIISSSYNQQFLLANPTLLDSARDSQAVHLAGDKRFQDQQVQSPLEKGSRFGMQDSSPIDILQE